MDKVRICGVVLAIGLILAAPVLSAQKRTSTPADSGLPQAIVAYGYLRWDYLEFDQLSALIPDLGLVSDLRSLDKSLDSLHCDVPKRMALPHETLILPPFWSLVFMALNAWVIYFSASLRAYGLGAAA